VYNTLGKGNLWLFYDIAPWHWMHSNHPDDLTLCMETRSATDSGMMKQVKQQLDAMPWAKEALPKIGNLKANEFIRQGFALVRDIEALAVTDPNRLKKQLLHLMAIANHEQGKVLQPLIYEDEVFSAWCLPQPARLQTLN
jgi:hypothetical protein